MAVIGKPRIRHDKYAFRVEVEGVGFAGFQKCSEIKCEVATQETWEGGAVLPEKTPGRGKWNPVTLERGATMDLDLFLWFQTVVASAAGIGGPTPSYERDVDIVQRDRDGTTLMHWRLFRAWPKAFSAGEWDNASDDKRMESVELEFAHAEPIPVASLT